MKRIGETCDEISNQWGDEVYLAKTLGKVNEINHRKKKREKCASTRI